MYNYTMVMNCQNEQSMWEVIQCEGTRWPLPHFLLPFLATIITGHSWFVVGMIYLWESFEETVWMLIHSYQLIFPGTPNTRESRLNSILLDPMTGFAGMLLALWLTRFFKSPFFRSRLNDNEYIVTDPYTRELKMRSFDEDKCGLIKKYITKYSIFTCNGRWFIRYIGLFCAVALTFALLDEKKFIINGNYIALVGSPAVIMLHAWLFSGNQFERLVVFNNRSTAHYYKVHGMIALVFFWIIGTLLLFNKFYPDIGTSLVIMVSAGVFVLIMEVLKALFKNVMLMRRKRKRTV
jgi:hypothetical protein